MDGGKRALEPARGAVDGIKKDLQRAKEAQLAALRGEEYNPAPSGVSSAWTHNFLNQKPWHPMNFRNRLRVFEAEQAAATAAKAHETAKAEFEAEQERLRSVSYLSAAEQERYKQVQSISFMYAKPPGLDAALEREQQAAAKKAAAQKAQEEAGAASGTPGAAAGAGPGPGSSSGAGGGGSRSRLPGGADPVAAVVAAKLALQRVDASSALVLKQRGRSPPRGGLDPGAENQQLLVDDEPAPGPGGMEAPAQWQLPGPGPGSSGAAAGGRLAAEDGEEALLMAIPDEGQRRRALKRLRRARRREARELAQQRELAAAEAVLRAAGYDPRSLQPPQATGDGGAGAAGARSDSRKRSGSRRRSSDKSRGREKRDSGRKSSEHKRRSKDRHRRRSRSRSRSGSSSSSSTSSSGTDSGASSASGSPGGGRAGHHHQSGRLLSSS